MRTRHCISLEDRSSWNICYLYLVFNHMGSPCLFVIKQLAGIKLGPLRSKPTVLTTKPPPCHLLISQTWVMVSLLLSPSRSHSLTVYLNHSYYIFLHCRQIRSRRNDSRRNDRRWNDMEPQLSVKNDAERNFKESSSLEILVSQRLMWCDA